MTLGSLTDKNAHSGKSRWNPLSHYSSVLARHGKLAVFILALLAIWSAIFSHTFTRPFEWDDLHLIRHYSLSELLSTFHGPNDPDRVETPALRPIATLLFHLQGTVFGEHMILERTFMVLLMGVLLWTVGLLLCEVGLSFSYIATIFMLFVSSRVFASLVLWITSGSLILAYVFMTLSALVYLRWIKRGSVYLLILTFVFTGLAAFTREEAYTLPLALPLIWWLSTSDRKDYRRPLAGALGVLIIVTVQYALRTLFIADAPHLGHYVSQAWKAVVSAWLPGGAVTVGWTDRTLQLLWVGFLVYLAVVFVRFSDNRQRAAVLGTCVLGLLLSAPHLGVTRAFGIALPELAFFTAISIAVLDVQRALRSVNQRGGLWHSTILILCLSGLVLGVASGVRRSLYVAQSLDENSVEMVFFDGLVVFDMLEHVETVPAVRRRAVIEHLAALGIRSREDVIRLKEMEDILKFRQEDKSDVLRTLNPGIFAEKYQYPNF